jgi:hypothetical protein
MSHKKISTKVEILVVGVNGQISNSFIYDLEKIKPFLICAKKY